LYEERVFKTSGAGQKMMKLIIPFFKVLFFSDADSPGYEVNDNNKDSQANEAINAQ
jgi:hypothetical protein